MKKLILQFILILYFFSSNAQQWEPMWGPMANDIYCIANFKDNLFIGTYSGTHYSQNNGIDWQQISTEFYPFDMTACGSKLFAVSYGIYVTSDGTSWNKLDIINPINVRNIVADGSNLYISGYSQILFSPDSGINWQNIGNSLPAANASGLIKLEEKIFVAKSFFDNGPDTIYSTADTGKTWIPHAMPFNGGWLNRMATDGFNLFVGTGGSGVLVSSDEGNSWSFNNSGLPYPAIQSVEELIVKDSILFAATRNGIYRSTIGIYNWTTVGLINKFINRIFFNQGDLYAATNGEGLFKSSDNGTTWQLLNQGIYPSKRIENLAGDGNDLWAASSYWGGLYKSTDMGKTWQHISDNCFVGLYVEGNNIYGGDFYGGIWVSHDSGNSFFHGGISGSFYINNIAGTANALYANDPINGELYRSTYNGSNWNPVIIDSSIYIYSVFTNENRVYAGADNGIYRSIDGINWQECNVPINCGNVTDFAKNDNGIFCICLSGLFTSMDEGLNWTKALNYGFPPSGYPKQITSLNNNLYCSIYSPGDYGGEISFGIYVSSDQGDNWVPVNSGLTDLSINELMSYNNNLFAGIGYAGVYRFDPVNSGISQKPQKDQYKLFPNPTSGFFTIQTPDNTSTQITIYNTLGEKIMEFPLSIGEGARGVRLSQPKGIYFLEIISEGKREMRKIVMN